MIDKFRIPKLRKIGEGFTRVPAILLPIDEDCKGLTLTRLLCPVFEVKMAAGGPVNVVKEHQIVLLGDLGNADLPR